MTRERVVDQRLCSLSLCLRRNHNTAAWLVDLKDDIGLWIDNARILAGSTCDEDHIRTGLTNLVNGCCSTGNCLAPYDCLNSRIRSHSHCIRDQGFCLCGEVIRIGRGNNHVTVFFFHLICLSDLLITLGGRTGNNTNLKISCRCCFCF